MMKNKATLRLSLLAAVVATALTGCGDDGNDGSPGEPGRPGGEPATQINDLILQMVEVKQVDGKPEVTILATDQDDKAVVGITDIEIKQYELYPKGYVESGDSARWKSNGNSTAVTDQGNGYYTFTFADDHAQNADLTQRYNVIASGETLADGVTPLPHDEESFDLTSDGAAALFTKDVVSHDSCLACHEGDTALTSRHSKYSDVETCISCHSETKMAGERVSFQHLVHLIHNDTMAFTDKKGNVYDGETAEHLIGNDCRACHKADESLSEWGNWNQVPTKETCSSCHSTELNDDKSIAFSRHMEEQSNSTCAACHSAEQIETYHIADKVLADKAADSLRTEMSLSAAANGDVTAIISLTDASGNAVNANDYADSYDLLEVIANVNPRATELSYGTKGKETPKGADIATFINADGAFEVPFPELLKGFESETAIVMAGLRLCASEGAFVACTGETDFVAIDSVAANVAIEGVELELRHKDSLDGDKCLSCHGDNFQIHNSGEAVTYHAGFTFNEQFQPGDCSACHTAHGTYAAGANQGAIEMKLHTVHGSEDIVGDCAQCHTGFNVESFDDKGPLATSAGLYTTPTAATCGSCHGLEDSATTSHMINSGGAEINVRNNVASQAIETCAFCHDADALAESHGVRF